jgi:hypothetical protein
VQEGKFDLGGGKFCGKKDAGNLACVDARAIQVGLAQVDPSEISLAKIAVAEIKAGGVQSPEVEPAEVASPEVALVARSLLDVEFLDAPLAEHQVHGVVRDVEFGSRGDAIVHLLLQ